LEKVKFGEFRTPGHPRHEQYCERVRFLCSDFENAIKEYTDSNPELKGKIGVSYSNIVLAVGRYFNDLTLFDLEHDIERFHRSKIIAYQLKWMLYHPPVVALLTEGEFAKLSDDSQYIVLNLAYLPITILLNHFLEFDVLLFEMKRPALKKAIEEMIQRLYYYAKTGRYDAKIATLFFEMLIHA
jgi:hypothetical protein